MKIAVVGAGNVGQTLGRKLGAKGHEIYYGVRHKEDDKYTDLKSIPKTTVAEAKEAVGQADVILLTTPWSQVQNVLQEIGDLSGKILIDCTNPIKSDFSGLEVGHTTSGGEMVAGWAKGATVVKCFNNTGVENMKNPQYGDQEIVMFAASDNDDALKLAANLARDIGFRPIELKGLKMARQLEQLAWLWISMAHLQGMGTNIAFALVERD